MIVHFRYPSAMLFENGTFICEGKHAHPRSLALRKFVACSHREAVSYMYI